jgi:phosphoglycolate phosphatase-like HAD superfamily hydrolase
MMRGLVLDFDGVLFDSAPEAFLVARRTYAGLGPAIPTESPLPTPGELSAASRDDVLADPLYQRFVSLMPLGNRAEDYAVILSVLERGVTVDDQAGYDRERAQVAMDFQDAFHAHFYEVRSGFQEDEPERWRALQRPYPGFLALLRRRASSVTLAIATAKDQASVRLLLEDHGLRELFPDDRLMDKETGRSKTAHLRHLQAALGKPFPDLTFVDDKLSHLDAVATLRVRCVLASWGYNGAREHELARQRGYSVCSLESAEELLFDEGDA